MPATAVSVTEDDVLATLRSFLLGVIPSGLEVVLGQVNEVAEPAGPDYLVITPLLRVRLGTNIETYGEGGLQFSALQPTKLTIQIDVHGPNSGDNSQIVTTFFRSSYCCDAFTASGFDCQPLYCNDARQTPFVNGEQQVEDRYSFEAEIQINPVVSLPQQSATSLNIGLVEVDATYPPEG